MKSSPMQMHPRLSELLDQLCDQQLDQAGLDELSRIVNSDPQACDQYVRYLEIHAHLFWDLATPSGNSSDESAIGTAAACSANVMHNVIEDLLSEAELADTANRSASPAAVAAPSSLGLPNRARRRRTRLFATMSVAAAMAVVAFLFVPERWLGQTGTPQPIAVIDSNPVEPANPAERSDDLLGVSESKPSIAERLPAELPELTWPGPLIGSNDAVPRAVTPESNGPQVPARSTNEFAWTDDEQLVEHINARIAAGWEDLELTASPTATDFEWVRRVYLDLAGRIPTLEEVAAYTNSSDPDRDRQLVNRLLESPDFAFQWSSRWTNLLVGRSPEDRVDRVSLQRYLRGAVEQQRGWDQVVQDLISAEGRPDENGATNFLLAHLNNQAVPATAFVAKTLLGTQIHCAQCHHHPFYELSQQEFWELNSFFKQATITRRTAAGKSNSGQPMTQYELIDDPDKQGPTYFETRSGVMNVAYPKFAGEQAATDGSVSRRRELAKILTSSDSSLIAAAFVNRTWAHLFGYGFTSPVDDMGPHNPPTHPQLLNDLAGAFVDTEYDVKRLIGWICLSRPYRLSSQRGPGNELDEPARGELPAFSRMYHKPLTAEQLYDSLLAINGQYDQLRKDWELHVAEREHWVNQFVNSLNNDENAETDHFDGSISQALVLMNGSLVEQTTSVRANPQLAQLKAAAVTDLQKFEQLSLLVLARQPRPEELALFRKLSRGLREVRQSGDREQLLASRLEDVMWAYLNSSEFIINH